MHLQKLQNLLFSLFLLMLPLLWGNPAKAVSFSFGTVPSATGDCVSNMIIRFNQTATGLVNDNMGQDYMSLVVYDAYGTALFYNNQGFAVGTTFTFLNLMGTGSPFSPAARPFTIKAYDISVLATSIATAEIGAPLDSVTFDPAPLGVCTSLPLLVTSSSSDGIDAPFSDGRINNWDMGNPVVIFGHDDESGRGLVVYSPEGELLLVITAEDIAAVEECPAENTLIASAGDVALYRLTDCRYQLNAPSLDGTKTYVLIFNDLYENTGYTSYEE